MRHTRATRLPFTQLTEERVVRVSGGSEGGVPRVRRVHALREDGLGLVGNLSRCSAPRRGPAGRRGGGRLVLRALRSEQSVEILKG